MDRGPAGMLISWGGRRRRRGYRGLRMDFYTADLTDRLRIIRIGAETLTHLEHSVHTVSECREDFLKLRIISRKRS